MTDLIERLDHCSQNTKDEYLHELTGRARDALRELTFAVSEPDMPGSFVGDIWFGHPTKRTLGTHKWDGAQWVVLPDEIESVLTLLATERTKSAELAAALTEANAKLENAREKLAWYADAMCEGVRGEDE